MALLSSAMFRPMGWRREGGYKKSHSVFHSKLHIIWGVHNIKTFSLSLPRMMPNRENVLRKAVLQRRMSCLCQGSEVTMG